MKTTVELPDELMIEVSMTAAEQRTTIREIVERALRRELMDPQPESPRRPGLRWVIVEGGLPPGVDATDRQCLRDWIEAGLIVIDTNMLVWAHRSLVPEYAAARAALERATQEESGWAMAMPSVLGFWSVVTHPAAVGRPSKPDEARGFITALVAAVARVLTPRTGIDERRTAAAAERAIVGARAFDLEISASPSSTEQQRSAPTTVASCRCPDSTQSTHSRPTDMMGQPRSASVKA